MNCLSSCELRLDFTAIGLKSGVKFAKSYECRPLADFSPHTITTGLGPPKEFSTQECCFRKLGTKRSSQQRFFQKMIGSRNGSFILVSD